MQLGIIEHVVWVAVSDAPSACQLDGNWKFMENMLSSSKLSGEYLINVSTFHRDQIPSRINNQLSCFETRYRMKEHLTNLFL